MGKDKKKWLSAYGVSLIVHIVFVGIIGAVVCITPTQKKEIVVEVTLDGGGGGGGGGGSRGKNLTESSIPISSKLIILEKVHYLKYLIL